MVDEYQDIGPEEYALIAAVAGRTIEDEDMKLSLFAVGDDDQNIYAFKGASIRYIRQFEQDYRARPEYLVENYRSTGHTVGHLVADLSGDQAFEVFLVCRLSGGDAAGPIVAHTPPPKGCRPARILYAPDLSIQDQLPLSPISLNSSPSGLSYRR